MGKIHTSLLLHCAVLVLVAIRAMYNSRLHCQFCATHTFTKPKDLLNHEDRAHRFAVQVNRKGVQARHDMELCAICNLYLDPGVSLAFSSHLQTTYHRLQLGESSSTTFGGTHLSERTLAVPRNAEFDENVEEVDVVAAFEAARDQGNEDEYDEDDSNKRLLEDYSDGGADSDDAVLRVSGQIGSVSHVDWLHDRSDNLLYSAHPDIGYVFLCPFNFTTWDNLSLYPAAALEPLNYGRYRFVGVIRSLDGKEVIFYLFYFFILSKPKTLFLTQTASSFI